MPDRTDFVFEYVHRSDVPEWGRHLIRLTERILTMTVDLAQAESDLAAVVAATVSNEQGLAAQIADLQAKLANGDTAGAQQIASTIEASVATLQAALPAAPAPAEAAPSDPAPADPAPVEPAPADPAPVLGGDPSPEPAPAVDPAPAPDAPAA